MNVCFIGKYKYPKDIFSNEQDMKTWRSMAKYFGRLFIITESPDLFFHTAKENNIFVYLIPGIGYIGFVIFSVFFGFYLNLRYGINAFDASEVAGGGTAVTFLKFLTSRPSVIEVQGEVFRKPESRQNLKSRLLQKIGRWAMNHAARVRVISHAIFSQVNDMGISENKIRLVSLRTDLDAFNPAKFPKKTSYELTIGYIGRLVDGKGLEDLLEAISTLKSQNSNFDVLIYGAGPLELKLKKMAQELGISNLLKWGGFVPYSKVPAALSEIDIFVYPSWHEGFGRSIMEALAMGKAVVASRIGGIPDLIRDGENGFLVSPNQPDELAGKIKILLADSQLRKKFGEAGREWVSRNFEWNEGIKKFADLFLELK